MHAQVGSKLNVFASELDIRTPSLRTTCCPEKNEAGGYGNTHVDIHLRFSPVEIDHPLPDPLLNLTIPHTLYCCNFQCTRLASSSLATST